MLSNIVRAGDIIGSRPHPGLWGSFTKAGFVQRLIQVDGFLNFGSTALGLTHIRTVINPDLYVEATAPHARFGGIRELEQNTMDDLFVYRYKGFPTDGEALEVAKAILEVKSSLWVGSFANPHDYDYLEFIFHGLTTIMGYAADAVQVLSNVLGSNWKGEIMKLVGRLKQEDFVCSSMVGALLAAVAADPRTGMERPFKQPNGSHLYIEQLKPGHFASDPGFEEVWCLMA